MKPLIFFDGVCVFCDGFIRFILKRDKGKFALCFLQSAKVKDLQSVILITEGRIFTKSSAIIKIISELGGLWKLSLVFFLIPKFFRDFFYEVFGRNRYRLFGKKTLTCDLDSALGEVSSRLTKTKTAIPALLTQSKE